MWLCGNEECVHITKGMEFPFKKSLLNLCRPKICMLLNFLLYSDIAERKFVRKILSLFTACICVNGWKANPAAVYFVTYVVW